MTNLINAVNQVQDENEVVYSTQDGNTQEPSIIFNEGEDKGYKAYSVLSEDNFEKEGEAPKVKGKFEFYSATAAYVLANNIVENDVQSTLENISAALTASVFNEDKASETTLELFMMHVKSLNKKKAVKFINKVAYLLSDENDSEETWFDFVSKEAFTSENLMNLLMDAYMADAASEEDSKFQREFNEAMIRESVGPSLIPMIEAAKNNDEEAFTQAGIGMMEKLQDKNMYKEILSKIIKEHAADMTEEELVDYTKLMNDEDGELTAMIEQLVGEVEKEIDKEVKVKPEEPAATTVVEETKDEPEVTTTTVTEETKVEPKVKTKTTTTVTEETKVIKGEFNEEASNEIGEVVYTVGENLVMDEGGFKYKYNEITGWTVA